MSPSVVLSSYLDSVRDAVLPVQIPDYDVLALAAAEIDSRPHPEDTALVIQKLLGRAQSVDMVAPQAGYKLSFPDDHHLHAAMGAEWYYFSCNLTARSPAGELRRMGVLFWIQKNRLVGQTAQQQAGWSDEDCHIFASKATVVMDKGGIIRRTRNVQWPVKGGAAAFSRPGEDFRIFCGHDSMIGGPHVLPLRAQVDDGENLNFDLTLDCLPQLTPATAFFLRGDNGTGVTGIPTPGIEYSWPQVQVSGTITVEGMPYVVESGTGWLDHQLLMASLQGAGTPFIDDPKPFIGWCWMFFNLTDHTALTCLGLNAFGLNVQLPVPPGDGYQLAIDNGAWNVTPMPASTVSVTEFQLLPTITAQPGPARPTVLIPNRWVLAGLGNADPWTTDGTFNPEDWSVLSEMPVDFTDGTGKLASGTGYVEAIGYENVIAYQQRAVAFLETGALPGFEPTTEERNNMATAKKKVERLDDTADEKDEKDEMPHEKAAKGLTKEIGVFAKAAALYFDKLSEIDTKHIDKKPEKAIKDMMSTAQKAGKLAAKHVMDHSEAHKEAKEQAKKVMPKKAVDDMTKWVDEED